MVGELSVLMMYCPVIFCVVASHKQGKVRLMRLKLFEILEGNNMGWLSFEYFKKLALFR